MAGLGVGGSGLPPIAPAHPLRAVRVLLTLTRTALRPPHTWRCAKFDPLGVGCLRYGFPNSHRATRVSDCGVECERAYGSMPYRVTSLSLLGFLGSFR